MIDYISLVLAGTGTAFFIAGVLGLIRFPDVYSRLHALTKADNLGLGFIILSLAIQADSTVQLLKLLLIWLFVMITSATSCYLVAQAALGMNIKPFTTNQKDRESNGL